MNDNDKRIYLKEIFNILKPKILEWSMFEVLQFLLIINCPQFSDTVRKNNINGRILTNLQKMQKLLTPLLNETNLLSYQKMLMVIREIYKQSVPLMNSNQQCDPNDPREYRPRSMMINQRLLKIIQINMQKVSSKQLILWNTTQLIELLNYLQYHRFAEIIQKTSCDGFILICVASDRNNLLKLRVFLKDMEIQEIMYISQIIVAENYFIRYYHEEEENKGQSIKEISFKLESKKTDSRQSVESDHDRKILEKSAEKVYQENDFFLAFDGSVLKQQSKLKESNFVMVQDMKMTNSENLGIKKNQSQKQELIMQETMSQKTQDSRQLKQLKIEQTSEISLSQGVSSKNNGEFLKSSEQESSEDKMGSSQYPESEQANSQILGESKYEDSQYSQYPDQFAESQYSKSIKSYSQSISNSQIITNSQQEYLQMSSMQEPKRLEELRSVTLSLPFDLLLFENLHEIALVQLSQHSKEQIQKNTYRTKTFCIKGVKFGRDKENNYSYPDELSISSKHGFIFFRDQKFYLQDLGSKTGTFKQINKRIQIFDDILIQLSYEVEFTVKIFKREAEGIIKLKFLKPDTMPTYKACIKNNVKFTIGRSEKCNIQIDSKKMSISIKHAQIHYEDQKFYLVDCSQNGSWIRLSQKSKKSQPFQLQKGDRFRISTKKIFLVEDIRSSLREPLLA